MKLIFKIVLLPFASDLWGNCSIVTLMLQYKVAVS